MDKEQQKIIVNDLKACYTQEDLTFMLETGNVKEYHHLLLAYDITRTELNSIIQSMLYNRV